jgi:DNA-binding beta-propeller fold protein YncE
MLHKMNARHLVLIAVLFSLLFGCKKDIKTGPESRNLPRPLGLVLEGMIQGEVLRQRLSGPIGVAADNSGNLYVVDAGNNRLLKFDSDSKALRGAGGFGSFEGLLNSPTYVAVDNNLNVYVSDAGNKRISVFDSRLNFVDNIDFADADDPLKFGRPSGLAINDYGELWIADPDNSRIAVFVNLYKFDRFVADVETYSGLLLGPRAVARAQEGRVLVSDDRKSLIFSFDAFGIYLFDFGRDILERPSGISLDRFGSIWVIDARLSMIFCFDREGELIYSEGSPGREGPYSFRNPQDLTVLPGDMIAISDTGNDRVLIYKILYPE